MKKFAFTFWVLLYSIFCLSYSHEYTIMSYNPLNYPGSDVANRNPYFRTVIANTQSDILVVQEILSQVVIDGFLNNVLNVASNDYSAGIFIAGFDTDKYIF